jgi:FkbM family methyltransferase
MLAYALLKRARRYRRNCPQMAVFAHDFIGTEINVYGRYEDRELTALADIIAELDRSKLVLDVGANIGNHTLFFVQQGFARIHAFEPNPRTLRLLEFNTERHPQVSIHPYGLSVADGVLEAMVPLTNVGGASMQEGHQSAHAAEAERVSFEVKRYDDLALAPEPVGLLKIDVEGHEPEAIEGMLSMLKRDAPLVVFECNRKTEREAADQLVATLREAGYDRFDSIKPPTSVIPQMLPRPFRRALRLLERLVSPRMAACEIKPVTEFGACDYPMVVARRRVASAANRIHEHSF